MFNFSMVAQLILEATVKGYEREEFMNLLCDRAYRESGDGKALDLSNFNKWVNGTGQRGGFRIVNEYYRDPGSIDTLAEDIETLLIDSIADVPKLMERLELALQEDVEQGLLSFRRREQLLSGSEPQQIAKMLQYAITQRKEGSAAKSPDFSAMFIGTDLPRANGSFVGREAELERIGKSLKREPVLFLTGIRGTGKSVLALEYGRRNRKQYKNCVYIRNKRSFRDTIMSLEVTEEWKGSLLDRSYHHRCERLKKLKSDSLLILDGMEVLPEEDDSFDDLMELNCHVLVTTTLQMDENSMWIGMIRERKELLELYRSYYGCDISPEEEVDVLELIDLVHQHTYAVTMVALTVKSGCITAAELRDYIIENGLGFPNEIKIRTVKDGKRLRKPFYELLKGLYVIQELTQEQQLLLMNLTCIPGWGMDKRKFLAWSRTSPGAMCDLIVMGWIQEEDDGKTVVIQGLVREMVIEILHPTVASCRPMIRSVLTQCKQYQEFTEVSYREHDRLNIVSECIVQTMTAVLEHSEECALIHTQLSVYSFGLVALDRCALLVAHGAKIKRLDRFIVLVNLCKALAMGYLKTSEYMLLLKSRLKKESYQKGIACAALYEETEQVLQNQVAVYTGFLEGLINERYIDHVELEELMKIGLTESERWTVFLLGWGRTEYYSRLEFTLPEEKPVSGARLQMLPPKSEWKQNEGKKQAKRKQV